VPLDQDEAMRLLIANRAGLYAYIRAIVADCHLAEDALQQLSVVLLRRHDQIPDPAAFLPWARRAARLEALYLLRQRHPERLTFSDGVYDIIDRSWERHEQADSAHVLTALESCLEQLPSKSRQLIEWRFTLGLTCAEVAERIGYSVNAVYTALSRLYDRLEGCVGRRLASRGFVDD
jgi:RNA polymerase sigma-70 factor (ECF subfamily)